jgi:hypothetical protein
MLLLHKLGDFIGVGRQSEENSALGAVVWAKTGDETSIREVRGARGYLSHSDSRLYFGLGSAERIDRLTVQWPGGGLETLTDLTPGTAPSAEFSSL